MPSPHLFFDSSALFAGIISADGAARALLLLAEAGHIVVSVSEQVVAETERAVARKVPRALPACREALRGTGLRIVRDPLTAEVDAHQGIMTHSPDVSIPLAAMQAHVDFLVTLNRRHFMDEPSVAERSGLRIGSPATALAWVRGELAHLGGTA